MIAEIFVFAHAVGTDTAGVAEPGNTHSYTHAQPLYASPDRINSADDLMTRDDRHLWVGQFSVDDMQVRAANPASSHLHSNLIRPRLWIGEFCPFKVGPDFF